MRLLNLVSVLVLVLRLDSDFIDSLLLTIPFAWLDLWLLHSIFIFSLIANQGVIYT